MQILDIRISGLEWLWMVTNAEVGGWDNQWSVLNVHAEGHGYGKVLRMMVVTRMKTEPDITVFSRH